MNVPRFFITSAVLLALSFASGCATKSTAIPKGGLGKGVAVKRALPGILPSMSTHVPGAQYVFILEDSLAMSALSMAIPVPFVGEIAAGEVRQEATDAYKAKFTDADPYAYAVESLKAAGIYKADAAGYTLYPFVVIHDGADDQYRASLIFHVEGGGWTGRYLYHLPTIYPESEFKQTPPSEIASLKKELQEGSAILTELMRRDDRGELVATGKKVTIGSLHLVSTSVAGVVAPTYFKFVNQELVEETPDHVIVRGTGNPKGQINAGALVFGVHYFLRDLLHTYTPSK